MSAETGRSWPSYTKSTNPKNGREKPSRGLRLSERDGVKLRDEVRDWGSLDRLRPETWRHAKRKLRIYGKEARETENVFQNTETGEVAKSDVSHRFQSDYREMWYAKFNDLLRHAQERYSVVHTTMFGLTGSSTPEYVDGQLPPVDHWEDVDASNDAVKQALSRVKEVVGGVVMEFIEPHPGGGTNDGYLHKHPVLLTPFRVPDELAQKVLDAHVRNSPNAQPEAHTLDRSVSRSRVSPRKDVEAASEGVIGNLPAYLTGYLMEYGESLDELPEPQQAGATIMWATGARSVRPDQTANEWMRLERGEDAEDTTEWEYVGFEDGAGQLHEAEGEGSGGISWFTTGTHPPPGGVQAVGGLG